MNIFRSRITLSLILCGIVLCAGAVGFWGIEGFTLVDSLYMSAITVSTVGFGEVQPLTPAGRLFATALILCSFLALAFAGHTIGQSLLEDVWSGQTERKKMIKQIASLKNHYIVCGYGRVGAAAVNQFEKLSSDFVVIESDDNQVALMKEQGYLYITGDATHEDVLEEAGIKQAEGLLSLLNNDPDNLFVVLTAREMNPTLNILSRVNEASSGHKIIRAGADDVVSPFDSAGKHIASEILRATRRVDPPHDVNNNQRLSPKWITIEQGSSMANQTIHELSLHMRRSILGLRREKSDYLVPDKKTVLLVDDQILVLEERDDEMDCAYQGYEKSHQLVIIDDNPVIVKLYSRLFQKAGFIPFIATNGKDGLEAILKRKPHAAVIDYHLPAMSGIEVCRKVRRYMGSDEVKLILFTSDKSPEIHRKAMTSGANAVVIKSPETAEIIHTVNNLLKI